MDLAKPKYAYEKSLLLHWRQDVHQQALLPFQLQEAREAIATRLQARLPRRLLLRVTSRVCNRGIIQLQ